MKIKGINPIEQNVEKIVFGAVVIAAGLLTAKQFLTNPNAVSFKGKEYQPAQVDEAIRKDVDSLQARLNSDRSIDYQAGEPLSKWFNEEHDRLLGSGTRLVNSIIRPVPIQIGNSEGLSTEVGDFADFNPPAPSNLRIVARPYTLDEKILEEEPALASMLPAQPPFDISVVHIFADVNGTAIREILLSPKTDRSAIPSTWWDRDMAILDVVVEREHRLADGMWSDPVEVQTIPGEKSVRVDLEKAMPSDRDIILGKVFDEYGMELYEPGFYDLQGGEAWSLDLVKELEPLSPEAEDAVAKMERAWKELNKAQRSLDKYLNQDQKNPRSGQGQGSKGGGSTEGGNTGGGGGSQTNPQSREEREKRNREANEKRLQEKLRKAEDSYQASKDMVVKLVPTYDDFPDEEPQKNDTTKGKGQNEDTNDQGGGGMTEGGTTLGGKGGGGPGLGGEGVYGGKGGKGGGRDYRNRNDRRSKRDRADKPLFEEDAREVWVHDLGILTDTVYRYRMRVDYLNPFFGREDRLSDAQKDLAKLIYVSSAATPWSEPVNAVSTKQYYVIGGTFDEKVENRKAAIEVYVYTNGKERMVSMLVRPGEPIGERRTLMVASADNSKVENNASGGNTTDTTTTAQDNLENNISLDFSTGAVLLDVVESVAGATSRDRKVQVLVALADGSIVSFDPEVQRMSKNRMRLRELAAKDKK